MASKKMYNNGGMANNYTSGDGDSFVSPKSMDIATMGKERMNSFSKAGGLMGMRAGGDVTATPLVTTFTSIVPISNGPKVASGLTIGITATAGAVTAVTLVVAGEGYSIGDIITVVQAGGANCTLRVDAVRSLLPVIGDAVVFNNVPVGTVLPVYVDYVTATGTTATLLVAGV